MKTEEELKDCYLDVIHPDHKHEFGIFRNYTYKIQVIRHCDSVGGLIMCAWNCGSWLISTGPDHTLLHTVQERFVRLRQSNSRIEIWWLAHDTSIKT